MPEEFDGIEVIEKLIDELESFAQKTPLFFPHRVVIPDHEFFRISMEMRQALPSVMKEAKRIIAERDAIIENARQEHKRILETAEKRAKEMIREDAIVREAKQEAERIIAEAKEKAEELKREALLYTDELLGNLDREFNSALETINNGRRLIRRFLDKATETQQSASSAQSSDE